jgi:hypothetical protein
MKNQSLMLMLSFSALTGGLPTNAVETNLNRWEIHQKDQEFKRQWEENSLKKESLEAELRMLLLQEQDPEPMDELPSYSHSEVINGGSVVSSWGWDGNHLDLQSDDEKDEDTELKLAIEKSVDDQLEEALRLSRDEEEKRREEEKEKNKKRIQKEEKKGLVGNILQLCEEVIGLRKQYNQMLTERPRSISSSSRLDETPFEIRYLAFSDLRRARELMDSKVKKYFELVSLKSEEGLPKAEQRHERKKLLAENLAVLRLKIESLREKIKEKDQEINLARRQYLEAEGKPEHDARKTWLDLSTEKSDLESQLQSAEGEEISGIREYFSFVAKIPFPSGKEEKEEDAWSPISVHGEEVKEEEKQEVDFLVAGNPVKTWNEEKTSLINIILDDLDPKIMELWGQWKNITGELSKAENKRYDFSYDSEERKKIEEECGYLCLEKERIYSELSATLNQEKLEVDKYFSLVLEKSSQPKNEQRWRKKKELRENLHNLRLEEKTLREDVWLSSIQESLAWDRYYLGMNGDGNNYEFLLEYRSLAKGQIYLEKEGDMLRYKVMVPDQQRYDLLSSEIEEPQEKEVNLRIKNGILEYVVMTPPEGLIKEALVKNTNIYEHLMPQGLTPQILKALEPQILEEMFNRGHIQGTIIGETLDMETKDDLTPAILTEDFKRQMLAKMFARGHIQDLRGTWSALSEKKKDFERQLDETLEKESRMIADYFTFVRQGKTQRLETPA